MSEPGGGPSVRVVALLTAAALPDERARRDPHGSCVADDQQELDNARFADTVARVAARLAAAGLNAGDLLAIMLPNRIELITSMFAAWRLGAAVTPIDPALTAQEARYQVADAGTALIVTDEASAAKLGDAGAIISVADLIAAPEAAAPPVAATPDSHALLIYTSGTTGRPKGVMLDHANIAATGERIVDWLRMDADTRCLLIMPLFHVNGIMVSVVSPLLSGGSTYVARRFDASTFWATVGKVRPTFFSAVPTIYSTLVAGGGSQTDAGALRYVICGSAPTPRELISEFERRYGVPVVVDYGERGIFEIGGRPR
jgi:long-chain acyl-CoA synthetase